MAKQKKNISTKLLHCVSLKDLLNINYLGGHHSVIYNSSI